MSELTCPDCGKTGIKNMGAHKRFCKPKEVTPSESIVKEPIIEAPAKPIESIQMPQKTSWLRKLLPKQPNAPIIIKSPDKGYNDDGLNESERIQKFLKDAPLWTKYKPKGMRKFITEMLNSGKTFASCVFVSEARPPKVLYIPYEPERKRLILPEKGFYVPSQQGPPFFFHEDFSLELIHAPVLKDKFNLPAHVRMSDYNSGLKEGITQSADKFLDEIRKYKMVCYLLGGVTLMALFALIFVAYTDDKNYKAIASNMYNLTVAVKARP